MHFLQFCNIFWLICVQLFLIAFPAVRTRRLLTSLWGPTLATQVAMSLRLRGLFGISAAQLVFVFCFDSHLAPAEFCFLFFFLLFWFCSCHGKFFATCADFLLLKWIHVSREREQSQGCYRLELPCGTCVWNLIGYCVLIRVRCLWNVRKFCTQQQL